MSLILLAGNRQKNFFVKKGSLWYKAASAFNSRPKGRKPHFITEAAIQIP
jgi:hypothetical protein